MPRAKKEKQMLKTKEQMLEELKANTAFVFKMKFIKEEFWPALIEASTSIEDAEMLLSGFSTAIIQEFLAGMKDKKLSDLKLHDKLDKNNVKYAENIALLDLFNDHTIFDAKENIEAMKNEIGIFINDEKRARTLDTLKTKWVDEL